MDGLPLREGERESSISWSISLRQSPYLTTGLPTRAIVP